MNQHIEKERYDMNDFRKRSGQPKKSGAAPQRGPGKNGRPASANRCRSPRQSSGAASTKPYYQTKLQGRTGAQPGDYVIISDGKQEITTRVNLASHPFCKKKVGDRVTIKAVEWTLVRILYQGSEAYHKVFDADTQREHFGY